jgi:hypothetical protein
MLLLALPILGVPYERTEEYAQKQAILNERAARFKAETGFKGSISYNHYLMTFSQIYGNFRGIDMTTPQDTTFAGQIYDQVLEKLMPFISAREGQLFPSGIEIIGHVVSKKWVQKVNGYSVYPGGLIRIAYNPETHEFVITDGTVDIPNEPVPINISMEDAKQLMISEYKKSDRYDARWLKVPKEPTIKYLRLSSEGDPLPYRLYWSMAFFLDCYFIDVKTLEINHRDAVVSY